MARTEADLSTFTLASDYNPEHYKKWGKNELAALGDCKATAEVIKARLESHGLKIKEMYAIEHGGTDKTKTHFHVLVKFEPTHGATKDKIAEHIGVLPEIIEKLKRGGHSYGNLLAYLIHAKDKSKIQYAPEDVVTLAGTDYMDYYNECSERWKKARPIVAKKGKKTLKCLLNEAKDKMKKGEVTYNELFGMEKYQELIFNPECIKELKKMRECVEEVAIQTRIIICAKIKKGEITSLDEIEIVEETNWKLAYKYERESLESALTYAVPKNRG